MGLFVVVIPKMTFKFGAKNFNFIRVRLGQVRFCYVIFMLFAPQMRIITAISTSNNPIINAIEAWARWCTSAWYLPINCPCPEKGWNPKSTFKCNICSNFTNRTRRSWPNHSQVSCEWVDCYLDVLWVELKQILHLKSRLFVSLPCSGQWQFTLHIWSRQIFSLF